MLVAFSMYLNLNDSSGAEELARAQLREVLPRPLYDFLHPLGTEWDAPIVGGTWKAAADPGRGSLRPSFGRRAHGGSEHAAIAWDFGRRAVRRQQQLGRCGHARTKDNAALLANDMHLSLRLPHIWYRARLIVESGAEAPRDLVGVTLPGLPMLIAGSNGRIAWGYTNSYGDWSDIVVVDLDPQDPARYLTDAGSEPFVNRDETLAIRGGEPAYLVVQSTRWGPIVDHDEAGRPLALAWTAHDPRATNLHMLDFETATNVDEALLRRQSRRRSGAERGRCRRGRPHRLVADGPGAGACDLRLDVAAFVARAGRRLDRVAHARRSIRASSIRPRDACGPRTRARSIPKRGSRSWATVATTSARAPRRFATICWRCRLRAPRT